MPSASQESVHRGSLSGQNGNAVARSALIRCRPGLLPLASRSWPAPAQERRHRFDRHGLAAAVRQADPRAHHAAAREHLIADLGAQSGDRVLKLDPQQAPRAVRVVLMTEVAKPTADDRLGIPSSRPGPARARDDDVDQRQPAAGPGLRSLPGGTEHQAGRSVLRHVDPQLERLVCAADVPALFASRQPNLPS
jgi:hypothetical protein